MSDISKQEVWLRVYCATITGRLAFGFQDYISDYAKEQADQALEDFFKKFPPFQSISEESKNITAPTDPIA